MKIQNKSKEFVKKQELTIYNKNLYTIISSKGFYFFIKYKIERQRSIKPFWSEFKNKIKHNIF